MYRDVGLVECALLFHPTLWIALSGTQIHCDLLPVTSSTDHPLASSKSWLIGTSPHNVIPSAILMP
ncbi:Hypothetical protein HEAR0233 [Herminiimonas arsenicoxydans]|uniref:Uncharacterized protein n=1 Tax=Herminiimonas arsenicoxydans TaxID=204773 RepID=A4G1S5_HERAR|nr:Hypothetical protein HEAR0233 [Herminiimonas arsenicoxydans]